MTKWYEQCGGSEDSKEPSASLLPLMEPCVWVVELSESFGKYWDPLRFQSL
jgi:hypothetical protein